MSHKVEDPNIILPGVKLTIKPSIVDLYNLYCKWDNKLSEEEKQSFITAFDENYKKYKGKAVKIICNELNWCHSELRNIYLKFVEDVIFALSMAKIPYVKPLCVVIIYIAWRRVDTRRIV